MQKVFAEICVSKPEATLGVVEALIDNSSAVVIRANAYDEGGPTIFVHAYGVVGDINVKDRSIQRHWEDMLDGAGGDVVECGPGHTDIEDQVAPPVDLQFAIDVIGDGILRRMSCTKYSRDRFFRMMASTAALIANNLADTHGGALARRLLLAALGPLDEDSETDYAAAAAA